MGRPFEYWVALFGLELDCPDQRSRRRPPAFHPAGACIQQRTYWNQHLLGNQMPPPLLKSLLVFTTANAAAPAIAQVDIDIPEGRCVSSLISKIGHRVEGGGQFARGSGAAITFANGLFLVSSTESAVVRASKVGDPVLLCPIKTEQGCPQGATPTETILMMNLRTSSYWSSATSSRTCSGA